MKKRSKVLLANLALFVVFFTGTALVGGFHHSTFIRFAPVGTAEFQSVIAFIPDLSVTYFGSRYDKALIPFILYTHGREDEESYITIQTEHEKGFFRDRLKIMAQVAFSRTIASKKSVHIALLYRN